MESAVSPERDQSPWWLLLLGGILTVIIGILLLTTPAKTAVALAFALGLYWLIQGVLTLVDMFIDHSSWGWKLFMGLLSIVVGIIVMRHPVASAVQIPMFLVLFMGIQSIVVGIMSIVGAFKGGGWGAGILGAIAIFFGIILVLNFAALGTVAVFIWVAGAFAIAAGILQIVQAFMQQRS